MACSYLILYVTQNRSLWVAVDYVNLIMAWYMHCISTVVTRPQHCCLTTIQASEPGNCSGIAFAVIKHALKKYTILLCSPLSHFIGMYHCQSINVLTRGYAERCRFHARLSELYNQEYHQRVTRSVYHGLLRQWALQGLRRTPPKAKPPVLTRKQRERNPPPPVNMPLCFLVFSAVVCQW